MLITDEYRAQQAELHKNPEYGVASRYYAPLAAELINVTGLSDILDYGAGKGVLGQTLANDMLNHKVFINHYEPSNPDWSDAPEPADLVFCIDVLEHIEPECLDDVLDDLKRCVKKVGMFTVHTGAALKTLPDGRNAHLIQEQPRWWLDKLLARFELNTFAKSEGGFYVIVQPLT